MDQTNKVERKNVITLSICSWLRWRRAASRQKNSILRVHEGGCQTCLQLQSFQNNTSFYRCSSISNLCFQIRAFLAPVLLLQKSKRHVFVITSTWIFVLLCFFSFWMSHRHKTLTRRTWNLAYQQVRSVVAVRTAGSSTAHITKSHQQQTLFQELHLAQQRWPFRPNLPQN